MGRSVQVLGGGARPFPRPCGQASGGGSRRSPAGLRGFRGHDSQRRVRRRDGADVGPRLLESGRRQGAPRGLRRRRLKFTLEGERLHGSWVLVRMRADHYGGKRTNWLLIKHRDADAKPGDADDLLEEDRSVASGRTLEEIADGIGKRPKPFMLATSKAARADAVWITKPPAKPAPPVRRGPAIASKIPNFVEPQLAKLVDIPPEGMGWAHEVKLDGYRAQLRVSGGQSKIRTRTGLDWTDRFTAIAKHARALPDCMIDGEVVALDERNLPSFGALQAALSGNKSEDLVFFAFDLLFEGREDLRTLPLADRKARLETLLKADDISPRLHFVAHIVSSARAVFESACKMGLEGMVSKQLAAPYRSGRSG